MANPTPHKPSIPQKPDSKGSGDTRSPSGQSTTPGSSGGSGNRRPGNAANPSGKGASASGRLPGQEAPKIPGYEILNQLGRGNMGVIYKARQTKLNRIIALKTILAGKFADEVQLRRFNTEAEAVARLQHPNIVQVFNYGEWEGQPFLVMEYVDGGSLDQKLRGRAMSSRQAVQLTLVLARAIHVAHQQGIIHRDLKPGNILLTARGVPKITDFGLAKRLDAELSQTSTGAILGTPSYMSPEQARGGKVPITAATDVYGLGAMLYEFLTGRPPFREETYFDTIFKVVSADPVPPSTFNPQVPKGLEAICLKCLQKDPTERYMTANALADALEAYLRMPEEAVGQVDPNFAMVDEDESIVDLASGQPGSASPSQRTPQPSIVPPPQPPSATTMVVLSVLSALLAAGGLGVLFARSSDPGTFPLATIPLGLTLMALLRRAWSTGLGLAIAGGSIAYYLVTGQNGYPLWPPVAAGALVALMGWAMAELLDREQPSATLGAFVGCGVGVGLFLLLSGSRFFSPLNWSGDTSFILMFIVIIFLLTMLGAACGAWMGRPPRKRRYG